MFSLLKRAVWLVCLCSTQLYHHKKTTIIVLILRVACHLSIFHRGPPELCISHTENYSRRKNKKQKTGAVTDVCVMSKLTKKSETGSDGQLMQTLKSYQVATVILPRDSDASILCLENGITREMGMRGVIIILFNIPERKHDRIRQTVETASNSFRLIITNTHKYVWRFP